MKIATRANLLTLLESRMLKGTGQRIDVHPKAIEQTKVVVDYLRNKSRYDEGKFTSDDYWVVSEVADTMNFNHAKHPIVDNVMMPIEPNKFQRELTQLHLFDKMVTEPEFKHTLMLLVMQIELLEKHKYYYA